MRLPTNPVTTVQRALRDEVRQHYRAGRVVLAVDGGERTATAAFADGLADAFAEEGSAVFRASMDDFRRPRAERGAERPDAYDEPTFCRVLLDPFRTGGSTGFQLAAFDAERDAPREAQWTTAPRDAVLIVDGPFLLVPSLRGAWNWSVRLEAPVAADASARSAQDRYVRDAAPRVAASAIVENSDPQHPVRVFGDFC